MMRPPVRGGQKWCPGCQQWQPFSSFRRNSQNPHGLSCYCKKCADAKKKVRVDQYIKDGRCVTCGKPATNGAKCDVCSAKNQRSQEKLQKARVANNQCIRCGSPLPSGASGLKCLACYKRDRKHHNKYARKRRKAGLCSVCGKPSKKTRCPDCTTKGEVKRQAKAEEALRAGLCTRCFKNPASPGFKRCDQCRAKTAGYERNRLQRKDQ